MHHINKSEMVVKCVACVLKGVLGRVMWGTCSLLALLVVCMEYTPAKHCLQHTNNVFYTCLVLVNNSAGMDSMHLASVLHP